MNEACQWYQRGTQLGPAQMAEYFQGDLARGGSYEARAWAGLGLAYYLQQDYARAEESFNQAIDLAPDLAPAWNNLGNISDTIFFDFG